jgi:CDP-diacylglycerol--serine O-phosphatidyltransferase
MKKPQLLPNIITAFSLSCGLFVIFKMSSYPPGAVSYDAVLSAVAILILAAFLDVLDGALARAMKVESYFGGVFDSLSDAVSFGVAPSVVILKAISLEPKEMLSFFLTIGAMIYSISGVLRLVRFTVMKQEMQGNEEEMREAKTNFTGLPIPAGACASLSTTLFLLSDKGRELFPLQKEQQAIIATVVFFVIGYFMISRWKFPSIKALRIRVSSFQVVLLTAILAGAILFAALHQFALMLFVLSWAYLITAWTLSLVRVISGRRLKSLEDFEPDPEEES